LKNMGKLDQKPLFWLTTEESEVIFNKFKHLIQFDEPIPGFETRFPGKLEGILDSIKQTFQEEPLNSTVLDAAAAYFNQIIRGHPFQNGNKRLAVLFTHVFLLLHGIDFILSDKDVYNWAVSVAVFSKDLSSEQTKDICKLIIEKFTKEI